MLQQLLLGLTSGRSKNTTLNLMCTHACVCDQVSGLTLWFSYIAVNRIPLGFFLRQLWNNASAWAPVYVE